jgi:GNAT superfamily N-acetyltransferase
VTGFPDDRSVASHDDDAIEVRDAAEADTAAMAGLAAELGYPATPEEMRRRWQRVASDGRARVVVATLGSSGPVVGLGTVHLLTTIHADGEVAQLTTLVVSERARGSGVGRQLVAEAERWALERGAARIVVTTALHRAGAHTFYERLGYAFTGRRYVRALA